MKLTERWNMYSEIKRLKELGLKVSQIARHLDISRNTVYQYQDLDPDGNDTSRYLPIILVPFSKKSAVPKDLCLTGMMFQRKKSIPGSVKELLMLNCVVRCYCSVRTVKTLNFFL